MTVLNRNNVTDPILPRETVGVEPLGGDVVVRGLLLTERLSLDMKATAARKADDPSAATNALVPDVLAACVLDDEGQALWTAEQWQHFGSKHAFAALQLFNTAMRLSGAQDEEVQKN